MNTDFIHDRAIGAAAPVDSGVRAPTYSAAYAWLVFFLSVLAGRIVHALTSGPISSPILYLCSSTILLAVCKTGAVAVVAGVILWLDRRPANLPRNKGSFQEKFIWINVAFYQSHLPMVFIMPVYLFWEGCFMLTGFSVFRSVFDLNATGLVMLTMYLQLRYISRILQLSIYRCAVRVLMAVAVCVAVLALVVFLPVVWILAL